MRRRPLAKARRSQATLEPQHASRQLRDGLRRNFARDKSRKIEKPPRPRFFRAFVRWLEDVRLQLLLPVRLVRIRRTHMELAICGFGDCVKAFVCRSGRKGSYASMNVRVQWNGEDVDGLLELDVYTHRTKDGYVCTQCPSDSAETYPTIEAAWTAHVFEVFLEFVNENLSTAACLAIHFHHGSSWASLTAADINLGERCVAVVAR